MTPSLDLLSKPYICYSEPLPNDKFFHFLNVPAYKQKEIALTIKKNQGVLLTEWLSPAQEDRIQWSTLYLLPDTGIYCAQSLLNKKFPALFDLSAEFPVCNRLQRAIYELTRIPTKNAKDKRYWLNHGHAPLGILNKQRALKKPHQHYPFHKVSGQGVHEIPVGPVHAGIIEPGHFRFSVVGERILKLEERLGYTHKGIHHLLRNKSIDDARKLLGRASGDSTVAYAYAFAKACEHFCQISPSTITLMERNICLERERLHNHIGDIGAIINDAGLPSLQAYFSCLKEEFLRHNAQYLGHRYFMDCIKPFCNEKLFSEIHLKTMTKELQALEKKLLSLQEIIEQHFGLQDRLCGTGTISKEQAIDLGLLGVSAKASHIDYDIRRILAETEQEAEFVTSTTIQSGDVAARMAVRFKEIFESILLIQAYIQSLQSANKNFSEKKSISSHKKNIGIGMVEGWRGIITVVLAIRDNKITWCHYHDPSWQNWLALEHAVFENIVADFPLINKSFNLSYSGHDC